MSKGSRPRPLSVPRDEYNDAWARTFGRGQNPARVTHIPQYESPVASTYLLNDGPTCVRCGGSGVVGGWEPAGYRVGLIPEPQYYEPFPCPRCRPQPSGSGLPSRSRHAG